MSLAANFRVMSIAAKLSAMQLPGIVDVCPANASLLVRFDPDVLPPSTLEETVRTIEGDLTHHHAHSLETRIIEVPVWYEDPFTAEVAERFREDSTRTRRPRTWSTRRQVNDFLDRRIHRRALRVTVASSPWWLRRGAAVPYQLVERAAARGAEVRASAHRHPGADRRPRRLLRLHLLRAGRRRLPDVRHRPRPHLRPRPGPARLQGLRLFFDRATS